MKILYFVFCSLVVLSFVSPVFPQTSCPSFGGPTLIFNAVTKEIFLQRPTSFGNLLLCGSLAPADIKAHIQNETTQFRIQTTGGDANWIPISISFDSLGTMNYRYSVGVPYSMELQSSTVGSCSALENSSLRKALIEAYEYYRVLSDGMVGTPQEKSNYYLMTSLLGEYLTSTNLIEDCNEYFFRVDVCASEKPDNPTCHTCCTDKETGAKQKCNQQYQDTLHSWVTWLRVSIGVGDPVGDAERDKAKCLGEATGASEECSGTCDAFCKPLCPTPPAVP